MTFNPGYLFLVALLYLSVLFFIAYAAERGWISERIVRHPMVYALSLGVYTTSWSYYGSVGFAEHQGFLFLTIYLGPTLAFALTPVLLAPLLRLTRDYQLTSLADLFAFRYNSQWVGVFVTVFMLVGTLPYIALQIRAVTESIRILTNDAVSVDASVNASIDMGLIFCVTLTVFAILFGARHVSPREKHEGLVLAIAFESLIKLMAIISVGMFALFGIFGGPIGLDRWLTNHPEALQALYEPVREGPWLTLILLSFAAAFLLPRQFHMGFVENMDSRSLPYASWAFPLFLLLFNLAIPPILWAGQALQPAMSSDYYVLGVTLSGPTTWLPTIAFIGGISAASAMVIVTTLAMSQMALNHILLFLLPASYLDPAMDIYRWLLWGRRTLIGVVILTSYGLYLLLEQNETLVELGLVSFVAVVQFLPGIIGTLYWRRATKAGFVAGLTVGALVWFVALVMPRLIQSGIILSDFDLMEFMGVTNQNTWEFATFWSLSLNSLLFMAISLLTQSSPGERRAIAACFQENELLLANRRVAAASPREFGERLSRIIGSPAGDYEVQKALADLRIDSDEHSPLQLKRLRDQIERNLSGMLGPMLARMIVDARLQEDDSTRSMLAEHMHFIEARLEQSHDRLRGLSAELDGLRRYHRQILQDLPLGVCSLSAQGEILSWNQAMAQLSDIAQPAAIGSHVRELSSPWDELLSGFLDDERRHIHKIQIPIRGRTRWLNLHKAALAFAPGTDSLQNHSFLGGAVLLVEDLTDVHMLETELIHSERLASIGRLAAGVAHEIGNPVTGIACLTQNLRFEDDPQVVAESLDDILQQTERINAIVQSLITYSHGGLPEDRRFTRFKLRGCIAEAQRLVKLNHEAKQHQHNNRCNDDLVIEGDYQRLLQVFVNLLSNASDASNPGDTIEVCAHSEGESVIITVSDQGEGIPEDLRERVFEPFFTTKDPGKGTGLGLPLVYNIIRDHAGSIAIDSGAERGTRINIRLPQTHAQADQCKNPTTN